MQQTKATDMVHQITIPTPFPVGPVHVWFIEGYSLTLVDTGPATPEAERVLKEELQALGYQLQDIDTVVLTHHHPDHCGLAHLFQDTAEIAAHPKAAPWVEKETDFIEHMRQFFRRFYHAHALPAQLVEAVTREQEYLLNMTPSVTVDQFLVHGSKLTSSPEWQVIETPGHAQNHISLYRADDGGFIGGDHLLLDTSSNAIIEPPHLPEETRPKTLLEYRSSLKACAALNISMVYPGHGPVFYDAAKLIEQRLIEQEERGKELVRRLQTYGEQSAFELCEALFPNVHKKQPALTMSEIVGHLDMLEAAGEIGRVQRDDEMIRYKVDH
ncbi:glyoxylase-like metal-dependent hydrolase (beta-lactamase superfamily II) [Salsuginibacillus halophilus]|uniref:Glyoxylase-like metal-dependent hydrolase (Beta-lactamase superfamily II) n=1 Tax=Salsuginibacillus halophilus TaxID=517424 RepID=A0A2P8HBT5_9BACI|nr:MBL fold metallo-hydrolase [Salsuginibacillus halophilus]PSL43591.1 glyoxylase-like metal-dependent hydrolase (beta-lactamase superfamily II) [Salsuginibacillus halophilus]